jgi:signal peptidase II
LGVKPRLLGVLVALAALIADQANKLWLIDVFHIAEHQPMRLTPFFDVVYALNPGISYSLLSAHSELGRWALVAGTLAATLLIGVWLWRAASGLVAFSLGLIVGGALGNASDRLFYGAVADFYHFHAGNFSWYIFNLADCAIVAGVALLLYDSLISKPKNTASALGEDETIGQSATKSPRSEA